MRLSTVILPTFAPTAGHQLFQRAEQLGLHAAYTYDHLTWRSFQERDWHAAIPLLAAAAVTTERILLGTLVTSPNFRHPVTLAKELITLDHLSSGRYVAGIGAGGVGFDATALGQQPWGPQERSQRFAEFVQHLDALLTQPRVNLDGAFYQAVEARAIPGCVQQPRVPFAIAAAGPRAMDVVARHGQSWITYGDPRLPERSAPTTAVILEQRERLEAACGAIGRDPATISKVLLVSDLEVLRSATSFDDFVGPFVELGIDEIVIPWPVVDSTYDYDLRVFEELAQRHSAEGASRVRE